MRMESTFLPLEIAHEHRNYLPLFGILLAVVSVLVRTLEKPGPAKTFGIALMATMLTYFPFVTALRADQFGDEVRRTQIEAQHHRGSARAQHEAGRVLAGLAGIRFGEFSTHTRWRRCTMSWLANSTRISR